MIGDSKAATEANVVVIPFRTPANLKDKKPIWPYTVYINTF